ncbi:MAG: DUF3883 domain-containing protein [Dehalococcoidia bacterium]|nr:DUF3883 domain-containing protein [Dehalococcoidia bacterium]
MAQDWTREEVEGTVTDYLAMLSAEATGQQYSKTEHRRSLRKSLNNRSDGAIERKHHNISAILIEMGLPYVDGYKPLHNYQQLLFDVVDDRLRDNPQLIAMVAEEVQRPAETPIVHDILTALVEPPKSSNRPNPNSTRVTEQPIPRPQINYLAIEAANRSLGRAGEEFVVRFEVARLTAARQERLAAQIEHVAVTRGDGEGYDVLSYETTGQQRLIEVKTTAYGPQTPFFVTRNELRVSHDREAEYHLYSVFGFRKTPRIFQNRGRIDEQFVLAAEQYLARPR